jgi:putative DNA methylase
MATVKKNKADLQAEEVAALLNVGKAVSFETVDFSKSDRPKTCLEVDFPILPINQVAMLEGNAGKPIYQMSKWWARRRSSVFRSMLIAAATKAPEDELHAGKIVWDGYYANHQRKGAFKDIKVAEIFMGGGTTIVEGARLGMQLVGNDLNPVAWLVVKNELAQVNRSELESLLAVIEEEVKPQIKPFYATACPRGHKAKWIHKERQEVMGDDFDPLNISIAQRAEYDYEGPEVIYTFWAKHGPCQGSDCGHRTPILSSPLVAVKDISIKVWDDFECSCGDNFRVEQEDARIAPGVPLFVAPTEPAHAVMDDKGRFKCPHCGKKHQDMKARMDGESVSMGEARNEKVSLSLLVHPQWLKGCASHDEQGRPYGGSVTDDVESTRRWNEARASTLRLLEVRGEIPDLVMCPETGFEFDPNAGTIPKKSTFACQEATCGRESDVLKSIKATGKTGPMSAYAQQCFCPECQREGRPYNGRYFNLPRVAQFDKANEEWQNRKTTDLAGYWPESELPYGFMTHHLQGGVPNHGFTHWWTMFNPRQLIVHTSLLRALLKSGDASWEVRESVLGAFQQYLRNQNMFCFWNPQRDTLEPHFSNNNYHPKSTVIENCVFSNLGRGNWASCVEGVLQGVDWCRNPWDTLSKTEIEARDRSLAKLIKGKSVKVYPGDAVLPNAAISCGSSTDLTDVATNSTDLVITDPPFGGLLHYSELSDFFYVWLRLALKDKYPKYFTGEYTPKTLEAVSNKARHPEGADAFYERLLTECWKEAYRILKPGGILAFTFHHSEDEPWVGVLKSLFDAGFYLEATYPIRSDESKGEGEFGSKTIEYDIIHVCRKRLDDPTPVSWAKLRRKIAEDVRGLQGLIEQHQANGLPRADMEVIRRGKALEYYSRHYGNVYVEKGRDFSILEALAGIHQLLDERDEAGEAPPADAEVHTRQFLRIFDKALTVDRNDMVKYLRGTGTAPSLFEAYGWCAEEKKIYYFCDPLEFAKSWHGKHRKGMSRDLDQTLFLIGACFPDSGLRVDETLNNRNFDPHPAVLDLLGWMTKHGGSTEIQAAARMAKQLYSKWLGENKAVVEAINQQFDLFGEAIA